jgi:hypothetical protein
VALDSANRVFPWLRHLSSEQLAEFYHDFFAALERTLQTHDWSMLEETIGRWQATTEILADAELTTMLTSPSTADDSEAWADVESDLFGSSPPAGA